MRDNPFKKVLRRLVGVYHAGRIINPKTARSQMTGGLTWGIGQALLEHSEMDHRNGRFLSKNLAGYLLPVNADVATLDVAFIDEPDPHRNPLGAHGIGELGAIGVGAAIANAVFHATGYGCAICRSGPSTWCSERELLRGSARSQRGSRTLRAHAYFARRLRQTIQQAGVRRNAWPTRVQGVWNP